MVGINLENTTLKEIKDECIKHQTQGRDCETCKFFRFCNYQLTVSYPSGWKLEDSINVKRD